MSPARADGHPADGLRVEPGVAETLCCLIRRSHPLAGRDGVPMAEAARYPWVLQDRGAPIRVAVERAFWAEGLDPPADITASSSPLLALAPWLTPAMAVAGAEVVGANPHRRLVIVPGEVALRRRVSLIVEGVEQHPFGPGVDPVEEQGRIVGDDRIEAVNFALANDDGITTRETSGSVRALPTSPNGWIVWKW